MRENVIEKEREGQCLSQTAHENPIHSHASGFVCGLHTHTLTHALHATRYMCPCSSPPCNINPSLSQSGAHSLPTLMRFLLNVYNNNLFHPSKRAGHGKKGPALKALLHLLLRLSSETKSLHRHHSVVQLQLKRDGDQIPLIHNKTTL